jgi:NNP family nitrate/nitrite transporter-like MFS transporter
MFVLSLACLLWLHLTVQKMMREKHPEDMQKIEEEKATIFEDYAKEAAHVD